MTADQLLNAFEAAWRAGPTPLLADFLPADPAARQALLAELVHLDLEFRLKRGEAVRVEGYLAAYPQLADNAETTLELLLAECRLRSRTEPDLGLDEYLRRFPQYAAALPDHFRGPSTLRQQAVPGAATLRRNGAGPASRRLVVPGCDILREIGRGGMGVVYLARQTALDRLVAVKMIHPRWHADEEERQRFRTEILAAARLRHPHIAQLYEVGEVEGQPYYIFEYLEGGSLADRLNGVPVPAEAAALVEPLARAMYYAHEQGVVHRDLKPENILLSFSRERPASAEAAALAGRSRLNEVVPKIADFGLAKFLEAHPEQTRTGVILGTACYMAPEQASGRPTDVGPAADIYALGAILYELLTGRPPFQGATVLSTLDQVRSQEPVPPSQLQPRLPRDLETICLKCLHKEPGKRYATAAALADDLRRYREGQPILARPTPWWEKANKWRRRQPLAAAALAALALALVSGVAGITWQWRRAVAKQEEAESARAAEATQRDAALRQLYFSRIAGAQHAWLLGRAREAERLLADCRADTPELCLWEWHYLRRLPEESRQALAGHDAEVRGLVVTPDGRRVISASGLWRGDTPGRVIVRDAATGANARELPGVGLGVHYLALHPDGKRLAAAGYDGTVRLWDLDDPGRAPALLRHGDGNSVFCVAFDPAGERLVSACLDRTARVWDLRTLRQTRRLVGHRDNVFSAAFSPDGKWLATASREGTVIVRDAATLEPRRRIEGQGDARVVTFSPDSRRLALGTFAGLIRVWDLRDEPAPPWTYAPDAGFISGLAFSPDGQYLAWSTPRAGRILDLAAGRTAQEFRGHDNGMLRVAFSPDMRRFYTGGGDGTVRVWDLTAADEPRDFFAHRAYLYQLAFSPDGKYLALPGGHSLTTILSDKERTLIRRAVDDGEPELVFRGHEGWLTCVAYRPDGRQIATGADDKTVRLWDATTAAVQQTLKDHGGAVTGVAYAPDGRSLVSGCEDGRVRLWDAESGELARVVGEQGGPVTALACSPVAPLAASAGGPAVRLWDLDAGALVREVRSPTGAAAAGLTFSPDGTLLACAFDDGTVRLYETATGDERTPPQRPMRLSTHAPADEGRQAAVAGARRRISLAFHPDGRRLVSATLNCPVQLWDVPGGQEALALAHPSAAFLAATFSPDGHLLAASHGSSLVLWNARPRGEAAAGATDPDQVARDWHETLADKAEAAKDWYALAFHGRQLQELKSDRAQRWYQLAIARLALGDVPGYRRTCADMLRHFAATEDSSTASLVAYACAVDPEAGGNPKALVALATRAVGAFAGNERALGAALHRAGDHAEALRQFEKAAPNFRRRAWDWLFLALIQHSLHDAAAARNSYDEAIRWLSSERPFDWKEGFEVQALKREAEQRLQITPPK